MDGALISMQDIGVRFGRLDALKGINLNLHRQEFSILLGSSGAGKTTLLRSINFLVIPTSGRIVSAKYGVISQRRLALMRRHRRDIAMVFQQHQLIGRLTALDNVLIGRLGYYSCIRTLLPFSRRDQELALSCLERVGLLDKSLEKVSNLSGGQKQRVGVARALAQQPKIILADEPIASLDPKSSDQILMLLKNICTRDGIACLISLHQVEFAKKYGDRVIGISNGSLCFDRHPNNLADYDLNMMYQSDQEAIAM
ncbi:MAG: phosphonate ABC transporter ATP-binding protein [Cyanobium sp. NAT70]|nr:phosphonate ABC transporter ATP-binding protein [Cyanobium sp. NAT70]|tara:strand:+ start:2989 stop:3753 length:765 start_codon:yes stop_codon:yes gene_type:complete